MEATFVGHQTWLLEHGGSAILVDPVLTETFGHSELIFARVFPPRKVELKAMPRLNAVILSHEHCDHFTFETFAALPKKTPVFVGPLMPRPVTDALESLGFKVRRWASNTWEPVGELEFRLFPVIEPGGFWEQRVSQVFVRPRRFPAQGVYIGVDAAMSRLLISAVQSAEVQAPRLVIVANNSQVVPKGGKSIYHNLLEEAGGDEEGPFVGLDLLDALTLSYVKDLPEGCQVAFAGNGFVHTRQPFGPYMLSDNRRLAQIANRLSVKPWVHGPRPGEKLVLGKEAITQEQVEWITLDSEAEKALLEKHQAFREKPKDVALHPVVAEDGANLAKRHPEVMRELEWLGSMFTFSELAALAHRVHEYLDGPLGSRRFVIRLRAEKKGSIQVVYDFAEGRFVPDKTPADKLVDTFPFGLEMFLSDFLAVLDGKIQIWDLDGNALNTWYLGGTLLESPVAFMFCAYGEQVRPDLAARVYLRALERLEVKPRPALVKRAACA